MNSTNGVMVNSMR